MWLFLATDIQTFRPYSHAISKNHNLQRLYALFLSVSFFFSHSPSLHRLFITFFFLLTNCTYFVQKCRSKLRYFPRSQKPDTDWIRFSIFLHSAVSFFMFVSVSLYLFLCVCVCMCRLVVLLALHRAYHMQHTITHKTPTKKVVVSKLCVNSRGTKNPQSIFVSVNESTSSNNRLAFLSGPK